MGVIFKVFDTIGFERNKKTKFINNRCKNRTIKYVLYKAVIGKKITNIKRCNMLRPLPEMDLRYNVHK